MNATSPALAVEQIAPTVQKIIRDQRVIDIHTHLYAPSFGTPNAGRDGKSDPNGLMLWGIDELVTYHYLVAEVFRAVPASVLPYEEFWRMSKSEQADHIWRQLFVERAPLSEACRGVLTTLERLGLDPNEQTLEPYRTWFNQQDPSDHIDRVMEVSGVEQITMTNAVFDDNERGRWEADPGINDDPRFRAVLRIDPILRAWPEAARKMSQWGFPCEPDPGSGRTVEQARRFLRQWIGRMRAQYVAVSLPPSFRFPALSDDPVARAGQTVLEQVVLPVCAEAGVPFAMMIGAEQRVNPALGDAGDMVGYADIASVTRLCQVFQQNRFLVTMLSRENQHELCVAARKFGNLMIFGCWWFMNNPVLIGEITRMRLELLGPTFIPQHSDARVLEQLIYKWTHSRQIIGNVLAEKFIDINRTGRSVTTRMIQQTVADLFGQNAETFLSTAEMHEDKAP